MKTLSALQSDRLLKTIPEWRRRRSVIARTYEFKDFVVAMRFVTQVAKAAEAAWHHPDIDIRWNKVTLSLTTHDAGGLTRKDFKLAALFDSLAARFLPKASTT